jgi:hypothetical protein
MADPTHKLYVDDSGSKEYSDSKTYPANQGKTPYFVYGGVLLTPSEAGEAHLRLRQLKRGTFGTDSVEIKSNWLRMPLERAERYIRRFGVSEDALTDFVDRVYALINSLDCKLIAAVVDKCAVQNTYVVPWPASGIAYEVLIQRAQMEMIERGGTVHVTVDNMTGATPKGNQYRRNLKIQHEKLRAHGSTLQPGMALDRIDGMAFTDSRADERIQLADLVAYAVYRQFINHGKEWDEKNPKLPLYDYLGRINTKFRNHNGQVAGFGIAKFPMASKASWSIVKKTP